MQKKKRIIVQFHLLFVEDFFHKKVAIHKQVVRTGRVMIVVTSNCFCDFFLSYTSQIYISIKAKREEKLTAPITGMYYNVPQCRRKMTTNERKKERNTNFILKIYNKQTNFGFVMRQ